MFKKLIYICLLTISVSSCASDQKDSVVVPLGELKYIAGDFYQYEGFVTYKTSTETYKKKLVVTEGYSKIYKGQLERTMEFKTDLLEVSDIRTDYLSENLEKGLISSHITMSNYEEACYNFDGKICSGIPDIMYKETKDSTLSVRYKGNSIIGVDVAHQFDLTFNYHKDELVSTPYGDKLSQKIEFDTYALDKDNQVVNRYGFYWWNKELGVVKKEYIEYPIKKQNYEIFYSYKLTKTSKEAG